MTTALAFAAALATPLGAQSPAKTPWAFLDQQQLKSAGGYSVSPDAKGLLYTVSSPDWKEATRQSDVYVVSLVQGLPATKQLTFTKAKNETSPQWSADGSFIAFLSNRDGTNNQLYFMRLDGGEGRKVTDAKEGVSNYGLTKDGKWVIYRSGKSGEEQLYRLPVSGIDEAKPEQLTKQPAGVGQWQLTKAQDRIYFVTADTVDADEKARREKKFTVDIQNPETPLSSLYTIDLGAAKVTRLTSDKSISVSGFTISDDGKWVGFRATPADRYKRGITEEGIYADLYLLETAAGSIERLTNNQEVGEQGPMFSPDSKLIGFAAPEDLTQYSMGNDRLYVRAVGDKGGKWKMLGGSFDGDVGGGFFSKDGKTLYFNEGIRATNQLMALDLEKNTVRQVTNLPAAMNVSRDNDTGVLLVSYSDPKTPATLYTVASVDQLTNRAAWKQLTDVNPQVREKTLGDAEEITWTSKDGTKVGGVLLKPVGYEAGKKYPLIVAIHGGPAGADVLGFNGGYGAQAYANAGYVVLMPNYRGSTNYGEKFKTGIVGNYFPPGFEDIMSGVDQLIAQGLVDGDHMGVLGWSAGGHWSNWILTHTDRFKAISSGAGTSNWISMYAQSDVQRNRQYYLGNKLPYEDFDAYWNQSPIKYIRDAKTPTMIHVVQGDPRVPSPQSIELYMALKKIGVPTELFLYPGASHGIPDARNQYVKSVAEKAWMDYYVRGLGKKFAWRDVLTSLDDKTEKPKVAGEASQAPGR